MPVVSLRAIEPEDLELLYRIENDVRLWNIGTTNVPYSRYVLHDYVANSSGDIYTDRQVRLMIENEQGEVVGIVDIINFDPQHLRAEVGIVIENRYRNRGYASSALRRIAEYSLSILHLHQLYAWVDVENKASLNLFTKAGYTIVAKINDWLYDGKQFHDAAVMQIIL
ncbi:MAG: GNAT family N-acetyltransferase [Prevotella sp.]|nr:GNAT family N-acetyltransferase [Prevotella sp.]MDE6353979.1 GNAT family N-acetyltransferase [Prevotella sp.]